MSAVGGSWFEQDVLYAWLAERGIKVLHQDLYSLLVKLSDYRVSEYERGKREAVPSETVPSEPVAYRWKWDKGLEWHYADYLIEGRDYYAMEPLYTNAAPQVPAKATSGGDAEAADGNRPVQIERKLAATSDVANPASAAISSDKEGKAQEQVKRLHATTDAQVWAQEFNDVLARQYNLRVDEGWLIGWFANAIEVGRDAGKRSVDLSARTPIADLSAFMVTHDVDVDFCYPGNHGGPVDEWLVTLTNQSANRVEEFVGRTLDEAITYAVTQYVNCPSTKEPK